MEKQHNETRQPLHHNDPETNRENQDHEFPGYPHHSPNQDVLSAKSDAEIVDVDVENFSRGTWDATRNEAVTATSHQPDPEEDEDDEDVLPADDDEMDDYDEDIIDPDADVTDDDLDLLGDPDQDMDGGDDELLDNYKGLDDTDFDGEPLNEYAGTLAASGRDLDMPDGMDLDGAGTALEPEEDEENDYYSLGADKDSLEDDQAGDNF